MLTVGILRDLTIYEKRVSIVPEDIGKLISSGFDALVESGAGEGAHFKDSDYVKAGASIIADRIELMKQSNIVLTVQRPRIMDVKEMKPGTIVVGLILPDKYPEIALEFLKRGISAFSLEKLPRISRAQVMDVLTSQSSAAGYSAVLEAACQSPRFMPMLTTAAGTYRPSRVLVIGAGVSGLMAIATAKRLGASVTGYDVRKAAGEEVKSLGARFLDMSIEASSSGGYARELTEEEKSRQIQVLEAEITSSDIIITTAAVPGKRAPMIISRTAVEKMKPGSVIVDLAADSGGNCELTKPGFSIVRGDVEIIGYLDFPSRISINSSEMFSRNLIEFLKVLVRDGKIAEKFDDEILRATILPDEKHRIEVSTN